VTRRALGRGRILIGLGSLLVLLGAWLPWWTIGGSVTAALSGNAFERAGLIVFLAAVGLLALLVLPLASRAGESALDRPLSYLLLAVPAIGAFLLRVYEIHTEFQGLGLPDRAPGLWLTGAGLALVAWGAGELLIERPSNQF
jgi:hypothetical protein